eukprot:1272825-Rhodomonas_salina.1
MSLRSKEQIRVSPSTSVAQSDCRTLPRMGLLTHPTRFHESLTTLTQVMTMVISSTPSRQGSQTYSSLAPAIHYQG